MVIEQMHYDFSLLYNRVNSNHKKTFAPAEIDRFLNRGKDELVEILWSGENAKKYKLGFEVTQQRRDMLSTLFIGQPDQPLITPAQIDNDLNIYEFDLNDLKYKYKHLSRAYVKLKNCNDTIAVSLEETDDLSTVLKDANRSPSLKWRRAVGQIKKSSNPSTETSLYVYTNGEFDIEGLYVEYLKIPTELCLGTYKDLPTLNNPNPSIKPQVNCDLPAQYHDLVIDVAVQEASRILEDVNRLQLRQDRVSNIAH